MSLRRMALAAALLVAVVPSLPAAAQPPADLEAALAAQRAAMERLSFMDGTWRGSAWRLGEDGERETMTQTERVGPFLDGTVKVIEGRSYDAEGSAIFNALAVVSYDAAQETYYLRTYAVGRAGDYELTARDKGFMWEIKAGSGVSIRYTADFSDGVWHEVGDRIVPGQQPLRFFEMRLERLGDTDWPGAGAVSAK